MRINPHASVYEAIELMSNRDVGALVVTSGNEVIGVMSERDYARNKKCSENHPRTRRCGKS